jgi:hypothetical protein
LIPGRVPASSAAKGLSEIVCCRYSVDAGFLNPANINSWAQGSINRSGVGGLIGQVPSVEHHLPGTFQGHQGDTGIDLGVGILQHIFIEVAIQEEFILVIDIDMEIEFRPIKCVIVVQVERGTVLRCERPALAGQIGVLGILPPNTAKAAEVPAFTGL